MIAGLTLDDRREATVTIQRLIGRVRNETNISDPSFSDMREFSKDAKYMMGECYTGSGNCYLIIWIIPTFVIIYFLISSFDVICSTFLFFSYIFSFWVSLFRVIRSCRYSVSMQIMLPEVGGIKSWFARGLHVLLMHEWVNYRVYTFALHI